MECLIGNGIIMGAGLFRGGKETLIVTRPVDVKRGVTKSIAETAIQHELTHAFDPFMLGPKEAKNAEWDLDPHGTDSSKSQLNKYINRIEQYVPNLYIEKD